MLVLLARRCRLDLTHADPRFTKRANTGSATRQEPSLSPAWHANAVDVVEVESDRPDTDAELAGPGSGVATSSIRSAVVGTPYSCTWNALVGDPMP